LRLGQAATANTLDPSIQKSLWRYRSWLSAGVIAFAVAARERTVTRQPLARAAWRAPNPPHVRTATRRRQRA